MFLEKVAQDIKKHSNEYLLDLQILFSNKRAIKYFKEELKNKTKKRFLFLIAKALQTLLSNILYLK